MLEELKRSVFEANLYLAKSGLVILTFGNVSGIDRRSGIFAIKPSGIAYESLTPEDIVLVDMEGRVVEGRLNPSSDTPTHLELYRAWNEVGGIVHAHSNYATVFAQADQEIPCFGTTQADFFPGPVPLTRRLKKKEVEKDYELNTGKIIVERFKNLKPMHMPAVLVSGHGPFVWGKTPAEAMENAMVLEQIAKTAFGTLILNRKKSPLQQYLIQKHFERKHGPRAYYGQKKGGSK